MAWGYLFRYRATGATEDAARARMCLDWLMNHRSAGYPHYCWGNEFTFTTRAGRIPPRGAHHRLEQPDRAGVRPGLRDAGGAALPGRGIERLRLDPGASARVNCERRLPELRRFRPVVRSTTRTCSAERCSHGLVRSRVEPKPSSWRGHQCSTAVHGSETDGSWFYGEAPKYHWIDSFHTGYNLDSLKRYVASAGDGAFQPELDRGYEYFKAHFFESDGRARYMNDRLLPIDIQCAAQAIDTLAFFSDEDSERDGAGTARRRLDDREMQSPDGYFYYRDLGWTKITDTDVPLGPGNDVQGAEPSALRNVAATQRVLRPGERRRVTSTA